MHALGEHRLFPPALYRIGDAQRLPVFGHGPAGNVHTFSPEQGDQRVIRHDVVRRFRRDQRANSVPNCLGAVAFAAIGALNRGGKEIFQLIRAARCGDVFIRRHAAHGALVQFHGSCDIAQYQRTQMCHAVAQEPILLQYDLCRDLQYRLGSLLQ